MNSGSGMAESGVDVHNDSRHSESVAQRNNRTLSELLQELRVAGLGVQVLFGFLLSLPFTVRFAHLSGAQRDLYKTCLLCAAVSIALLIGPVAYHRWHFRQHDKGRLLRISNRLALLGLGSVALAIILTVWLILTFVGASWPISVAASATSAAFVLLWFGLPLFERRSVDADQ
jgi:hypothetical protein